MVTAGVRRGPLVVFGDSMLDIDIEGEASRLSPEAPVPVVDVTRQRRRPGGAGLAALLAARSGRTVILLTAIGDDNVGDTLRDLLAGHVDVRSLPLDGSTLSKCRVAAGEVPLLRLDSGSGRACRGPLPPEAVRVLESAGAILVADYGRGGLVTAGLNTEDNHQTQMALRDCPRNQACSPAPCRGFDAFAPKSDRQPLRTSSASFRSLPRFRAI